MSENENENETLGMGIDYCSLQDYIEGDVVDLESAAWDGMPLGDGDYAFQVEKIEKKVSKEKNTPNFEVSLTVAEGNHKGAKIRNWYYLTPKAIGRWFNVLKAVGCKLDAKAGFRPSEIIGKKLRAKVITEKGGMIENPMTGTKTEGKPRTKVVGERAY